MGQVGVPPPRRLWPTTATVTFFRLGERDTYGQDYPGLGLIASQTGLLPVAHREGAPRWGWRTC